MDSFTPICLRWILDDIERAEPDGLGMEIDKVEWLKLKDEIIEKLGKEAQNARYN